MISDLGDDLDEPPLGSAEREVLRARRERLRAVPRDEDEAVAWVAEFPLGGEPYAFELERLRAAVPLRAVTPIPLAPPHVIGVLRFEGRPIAAFSLATLLGVGRGWTSDPSTLLVLDVGGGRLVAVDCEEVPRPTPVSAARLASAASGGQLLRQLTDERLRRVTVIDVAHLVRRTRERAGGR